MGLPEFLIHLAGRAMYNDCSDLCVQARVRFILYSRDLIVIRLGWVYDRAR